MRANNTKYGLIILAALIMLSLAMPAMAAPDLQATNTPTPTSSPTPTPEVGYKQQLSSGQWIQVDRTFSFGQIAVVVSVLILTLAVVLYIIWDIISHYIY